MWSSIKQIIKPDTLDEADNLKKQSGTLVFAGGSYLVNARDKNFHTLLDINHLLSEKIQKQGTGLLIGAGCTLQQLVEQGDSETLSQVITSSCPSKNIRNQRTLGGEIARGRTDSDLLVYLYATETQLQVNDGDSFIDINEWNDKGVISNIFIPENKTRSERVAVLDSAPAFVIISVNQMQDSIALAIGGKTEEILFSKIALIPDELEIRNLMDRIQSNFADDQHGTASFKQHLVSTLLSRMSEAE
mgnify:CR=1 FL=1